jgi:hypothetical protein
VGIGGLGKTTLAKLVFNDKRIDEVFQLKIWVCVSDDFDTRKIIIKIINSALSSASAPPSVAFAHQEDINHFDIEQLQIYLRHKLDGQKFIFVLDDIWNDDRAKWIELIDLIKDGAVESKIIVTTRSNSIASMMGTVPSYVLEGLSADDCLSLFIKWAFKDGEEEKYSNLVEIGREIVKKCAGVPLAVRTLGSSMFLKFDLNKWIFIRDHEIWNLEQKKDDILPALKLSYDQIPSYLRQCFASFSMFPKDFTFQIYEISSLWIALGLVQSMNGSENLNIAREYINELHSRSLLQDFDCIGDFCIFRVHDLLHDLALYVAKEDSLAKSVRAILFPFEVDGLDNRKLLDTCISRYKNLRYLNLNNSSFETLPKSIAKLVHLRVLVLNSNKIKRLPYSIFKLLNLQVFSFGCCTELETLPRGLMMMTSLQYLFISTKQSVVSLTEFATLNHLQVLTFDKCKN